jgi:hypothetical protein
MHQTPSQGNQLEPMVLAGEGLRCRPIRQQARPSQRRDHGDPESPQGRPRSPHNRPLDDHRYEGSPLADPRRPAMPEVAPSDPRVGLHDGEHLVFQSGAAATQILVL